MSGSPAETQRHHNLCTVRGHGPGARDAPRAGRRQERSRPASSHRRGRAGDRVVPDACWTRSPVTEAARPRLTGARFRGMVAESSSSTAPGLLALGPGATLEGPTALDQEDARRAGLGARDVDLYALESTDPRRVPLVYGWMSAAARRTAGRIVPADRSRVVRPDPGAAVDLTLWSPLTADRPGRPAAGAAGDERCPRRASRGAAGGRGSLTITATFEYDGAVRVRRAGSPSIPVALSALEPAEYGTCVVPGDLGAAGARGAAHRHPVAAAPHRALAGAAVGRPDRGRPPGGRSGGTVVDSGGFVVTRRRACSDDGARAAALERRAGCPRAARSTATVSREPEPSVKMTPRSGGTSS